MTDNLFQNIVILISTLIEKEKNISIDLDKLRAYINQIHKFYNICKIIFSAEYSQDCMDIKIKYKDIVKLTNNLEELSENVFFLVNDYKTIFNDVISLYSTQ